MAFDALSLVYCVVFCGFDALSLLFSVVFIGFLCFRALKATKYYTEK
jgi:hypothetical protein